MLDTWSARLLAVAVLLAVLVGLAVWFGALSPAPAAGAHPGGDDLAADAVTPGQAVQVTGTIVEADPVVIAVEYSYYADGRAKSGTLELAVTGVSSAATVGELMQVYGVYESSGTIAARSVVTIPAGNVTYMYAVSALAGLWVLARLLRGWRLDATGLVRRDRALAPIAALRARIREVVG